MFILLINSMGFPLNNFDPKVGDTFKTFYYSPFIILSFIFLIASLTIRKKVLNVSFIVLYLLCSIFIFGFPNNGIFFNIAVLLQFNGFASCYYHYNLNWIGKQMDEISMILANYFGLWSLFKIYYRKKNNSINLRVVDFLI